jgi:protein-export membrane protein SecD/preprotein translocase SecF subunit
MSLKVKFAIILGLTALCAWEVWPPQKKIKLGIDLEGGTSLLYQIDTTGYTPSPGNTAAQEMIRILQQRIDPAGNAGLVWRAHGSDRVEIQMPLASKESRQLRETYQQAKDKLSDYNLDLRKVREALIQKTGTSVEEYRTQRSDAFTTIAKLPPQLGLLEAYGNAHDDLVQEEARWNQELEKEEKLTNTLTEAKIRAEDTDYLYQQWEKLDDPNRTAEIERIAGADKKEIQQTLREYIVARAEQEETRDAIFKDIEAADGIEAKDGLKTTKDKAWQAIQDQIFDPRNLEIALDQEKKQKREEGIKNLKERYPDLASQGLYQAVVEAYEPYSKIKDRLDDPEDLKRKLQGAGVLEFRIIPSEQELANAGVIVAQKKEKLEQDGPLKANAEGDQKYVWQEIKNPSDPENPDDRRGFRERNSDGVPLVIGTYLGTKYVLAANQPNETMLHETGPGAWKLSNSRPTSDQWNRPAVGFSFNQSGTGKFWELTKAHKNRPLGIFLDEEAISAPNINTPIFQSGIIEGDYSADEVQDMVDKLNAGSLPARLSDQPISENSIDATIGKDNLVAGLKAGLFGLIAVAVFMLIYYKFAGTLADLALFLNLLIIMGVMAFSRATFTMPGIAGLILTIGMAVDANVLVFERIREEQNRGSSLRMAIQNGYGRALRTIMDANITTFVTALILYLLASEEVKGFALTLMIGIVTSMFTALFVTRSVFDLAITKRWLQKNIKMLQIVKHPKVDWMRARPVFWVVSGLLVASAWAVFLGRDEEKNSKYSIEFTGGTSIRVLLNEEGKTLGRSDVERLVREAGAGYPQIENARVQEILHDDDRKEFEIVTVETNRLKVPLLRAAGSGITAEALEKEIQTAAAQAQDPRRMGKAIVVSGEAPNQFMLETSQTNQNKVREVLDLALVSLSPLETGDRTEEGDAKKVILKAKEGKSLTLDAVQTAVQKAMIEMGYNISDQDLVVAGASSQEFIFRSPVKQEDSLDRLLDIVMINLADVQYDSDGMVTDPIVNNAVTKALDGKLDIMESLSITNTDQVQAQEITDELIQQKPYLLEYKEGVFLSARFGANHTETLARLKERFDRRRTASDFREYGDDPYEVFAPNNPLDVKENTTLLSGVEIAVIPRALIQGGAEVEPKVFTDTKVKWVTETLNRQTSLPQVTQIDPSVGAKSRTDAIVAIVFSLLAIIIYIWVRFGTMRFGIAAVAALVHDVSIAMGMVAASAWLADTAIGKALLISDFKIDLPMIAGFLTVIGYSLNDTIVVFDRVRENRGKLATLSANLINNSINQTISRTILTSVTTLVVLIVMYIWGGAGLRGFNYVLIIGVLVGTYSSIGIATPLLYGAQSEAQKAKETKSVGVGRKKSGPATPLES